MLITRLKSSIVLAFLGSLSSIADAAISSDVYQAMEQNSLCQETLQDYTYIQCMEIGNQKLKKMLTAKISSKSKKLSITNQQLVKVNINKKIKSGGDYCRFEQKQQANHLNNQRRYPQCVYETLLGILINIDRDISVYTQ